MVEGSILELAECLSSVEIRATHHYSSTLVGVFDKYVTAAAGHRKAESSAEVVLKRLGRWRKLNLSAIARFEPENRSTAGTGREPASSETVVGPVTKAVVRF